MLLLGGAGCVGKARIREMSGDEEVFELGRIGSVVVVVKNCFVCII